jgi:hypothetical protein
MLDCSSPNRPGTRRSTGDRWGDGFDDPPARGCTLGSISHGQGTAQAVFTPGIAPWLVPVLT